jgi:DNA-binding transcriptional ArsR family regulator
MEKCGENALNVHIKPEHVIQLDKMQSAIVMPSIYASRRLTFWYSGHSYLFYISLDTFSYENIEPSDMLLLKTLAVNDRTRLKMLKLMADRSYSTNEMAERLNMNASTVSRHFKVFKDAGFVDISSQEGNFIYYSLNIEEIRNSFKDVLNYIVEKE